jgi:hypothetical protein
LDTFNRLSVVVGLVLLSLVVFLMIDLPTRTFTFLPLGSPLTVQLSEQWLRAMLAAAIALAGAHSVVGAHPAVRRGQRRAGFTAWIVPGLIGFLAPFLLPLAPNLTCWLGGLGLTAILLGSAILLEYYTTGRQIQAQAQPQPASDAPNRAVARLALSLLTYGVTLAAFALIYHSRTRSLVTATATAVVSGLMALSLLRETDRPLRRTALYAGLAGLVMGQSTWALNYWRIHALTGGVLLLLFFYVVTGVAQQHLQGSLTRRVLVEFLAVATIGVWLLLRLGSPASL